jgi:hypothetical protein
MPCAEGPDRPLTGDRLGLIAEPTESSSPTRMSRRIIFGAIGRMRRIGLAQETQVEDRVGLVVEGGANSR